MDERIPAHRGCSYILPGRPNSIVPDKTHSCYCSQWRQDGERWSIWRNGTWQMPHQCEFYMAINRMEAQQPAGDGGEGAA